MEKYTEQNKRAWKYDAYHFWVTQSGPPAERAKEDVLNPRGMLKRYVKYFGDVKGQKIANICGSCGKKAVPLAILGAAVTVFDGFMSVMGGLLKAGGRRILSDFHPFHKCLDILELGSAQPSGSDYFSREVFEGEMAHAKFYDEEARKRFPKCSLRRYTLGEILNSVINAGFILRSFEEHPAWTNEKLPGEFTLLADKPA